MTSSSTRTPVPAGYTALKPLGHRTGLAEVLRVTRESDGAELTLTVLDERVSADERFRGYFLAVMGRVAQIEHVGIVNIVDLGEVDGRPWVVSAPPPGKTVRALVSVGGLMPDRALELLSPMTRALRTATDFGLLHHDLEAEFVLVSDQDQPILLEPVFIDPLAIPGARASRPDLLAYVAPERLQQGKPDARTDVHALGGLLLTALTGHPPGNEADRVLQDRERDGAVPEELDLVLWRALAADPMQRQGTPREFIHQAQRALTGEAPERFIRGPQPSVKGAPASSTEIVHWGTPRSRTTTTPSGPHRLVSRLTATVSGWSAALGGLVSRLRPGPRPGLADAERPAPPPSAARPAAELEAPRDDPESHQPPAAPPSANGAAGGGVEASADPAERLGAAAARLRRTMPVGSAADPVSAPAPAPSAVRVAPAPAPTPAPAPAPAPAAIAAEPAPAPEPAEAAPAEDPPAADPAVRMREQARQAGRRRALAGLAAVLALIAGGVVVFATRDKEPTARTAPAAQRTQQGQITLMHPAQWQTVDPVPPVLGQQLQDPVALEPRGVPGFVPGSATLVAGKLPQTTKKLLPPGLSEKLAVAPQGEPIKIGDLQGYRYRGLARPNEAGRVDLYVLGTLEGTLAVSCFAGAEVSPAYMRQCHAIAGSLRGEGLTPIPLGASPVYGAALRRSVSYLNRTRARVRRELAAARTPAGQARLSNTLAGINRQVAGALRGAQVPPADQPANERIIRQLQLVANSYDRMGQAARRNQRRTFNAAREQVRQRERRVDVLLRRLSESGYQLD